MVITTRLRILRLKYGISLSELAEQAGISNQQLSRLELSQIRASPHQEELVSRGFLALIHSRGQTNEALRWDVLSAIGRLLEPLEVESDEQ